MGCPSVPMLLAVAVAVATLPHAALASRLRYELLDTYESAANPAATVVVGQARFTVLTPRIVRMEWAREIDGGFEDRPTLAVINRRLPMPKFTKAQNQSAFFITTESIRLTYITGESFSPQSLFVEPVEGSNSTFRGWKYGQNSLNDPGNLFGTFRTLDKNKVVNLNCTEAGQPHCEPGLVSRSGWALINDTDVPVLNADQDFWADGNGKMLRNANEHDLYLLAHGDDYKLALQEYTSIGGRIPLLPRYASGIWFTRWYNFGVPDVKDIVKEYEMHGLPLDVFVFDMNWHTKNAWGGYTWDSNILPHPEDTLDWLRNSKGLKVSANLHDNDGVNKWETQFTPVCKFLNRDPDSTSKINFSVVDLNYTRALEDLVLHPIEKQGMDFWWIDWQQGENGGGTGHTQDARQKMNPTIWLNKMRATKSLRYCRHDNNCASTARGMVLGRFGGLGNHRYQLGFSGDVDGLTWSNLAYQPYFTATSSNVGFGMWSHDIVGPGDDPELYLRWIQWASYSGVMRSHDRGMSAGDCAGPFPSESPPNDGCGVVRPWNVPYRFLQPIREVLRTRAKLLPYLYSLSREAFETGLSPLRPMYYTWPKEDMAYASTKDGNFPQYMLGDDLLVRPIVAAVENNTGMAVNQKTWIPPGKWIHTDSNTLYVGPSVVSRNFSLQEVPVFVQSGAIIPSKEQLNQIAVTKAKEPFKNLGFTIFPGESNGSTKVYEDDGETYAYLKGGECAWTTASYTRDASSLKFSLSTVGWFDGMVDERDSVTIRIVASPPLKSAAMRTTNGKFIGREGKIVEIKYSRFGNEKNRAFYTYDGPSTSAVITVQGLKIKETLEIEVEFQYAEEQPCELCGIKGMVSKANLAKLTLDQQRRTPGSQTVEVSYLSQLAGTGEALSYMASGAAGGIKAFRGAISSFKDLKELAFDEVRKLPSLDPPRKIEPTRIEHALALLQSEM